MSFYMYYQDRWYEIQYVCQLFTLETDWILHHLYTVNELFVEGQQAKWHLKWNSRYKEQIFFLEKWMGVVFIYSR